MSLIDIGTEALTLEALLYEAQGEITPEQEAQMDSLLARGADALDGAAWVLRKLENDESYLKAEALRYSNRAKSLAANADYLRSRMAFALDAAFSGKLKTERNTLWMQKSADTLQVELAADADLARLDVTDSEFVKKTYALDTQAVKQRYQAGDRIPDAIVVNEVPGKRSLRMR